MKIQAAVQRTFGTPPVIEDLTIEDPRDDEILVKICAVGVCHTDLILQGGYLPIPSPIVLGHEGSGVIEIVGAAVSGLSVGDHVVLSFNSCGECPSCSASQKAYCHSSFPLNFGGGRMDGTTALKDESGASIHSHIFGQSSFATHAIVSAASAVKVDKDVSLDLLGPLGCGVQTGAGTIFNVLKPAPGASVAVIGAGAVGLSAIMAAKIAKAGKIAAIDVKPERVALARELGATHDFIAGQQSTSDCAAAAGCDVGFDYIIDTSGLLPVVKEALPALAPRGELAMVGSYPPGAVYEIEGSFIMSGGRSIRGVVEGGSDPQTFIPKLMNYYRDGVFPFDRLITFFDFGDIVQAFEQSACGGAIKPVMRMP
ncbi:MAG: NAD(P)-dependent alcohol dehydrogenase [Pseudomonadota bacterium]